MSKLTVTLPDDLHQQIRLELERQGITTAQFIELAVHNFFEQQKEGVHMATRTMAFQVSEELFQRIKEYLARFENSRQPWLRSGPTKATRWAMRRSQTRAW